MKTAQTILELLSGKNTIARVKDWLQKNKNKGRSALAQYLCRALNITDHLGKPRIAGVHVALRLLESRGFWKLPQLPRRVRSQPQPRRLNTAVPAPKRVPAQVDEVNPTSTVFRAGSFVFYDLGFFSSLPALTCHVLMGCITSAGMRSVA